MNDNKMAIVTGAGIPFHELVDHFLRVNMVVVEIQESNGKRQELPDGGCKGPQINRGKNKHRDRY
jgi:hypothetical protein